MLLFIRRSKWTAGAGRWFFGAMVAVLLPAWGDTVTLKPVADTTLFENNPDNNLGKPWLSAGTIRLLKKSRALVRFDLSAIPANATIDSAAVTFRVTKAPPPVAPASTFELRRVLQPWIEGTKGTTGQSLGAAAGAGEPTWRSRGPANWSVAGGAVGTDFAATASAAQPLSGTSLAFASSAGLVADVQAWVAAPANNHGWVLLSQAEGTAKTARRFGSRENPNSEPTLTVDYTVPAPARPVQLVGPERVGDRFRFMFSAEPNVPYTIEFSTTLQPGSWQTLTTLPVVAQPQVLTVEDTAAEHHRVYRVGSP